MIELTSTGALLAGMSQAKEIAIEAYTLHGPVLRAAEFAARRGARVAVRLAGEPYDDPTGRLSRENARIASELRAAGARVALEPALHSKEISVDGVRYYDEKNWHEGDLVVRDSAAADGSIAETKLEALREERELLRGARASDGVVVETESCGCCNGVFDALRELACDNVAPRLLVSARDLRGNERERHALEALARDGVRVRVCDDSEKLAAAGDRAWLGSANATCAYGRWNMLDWGVTTEDARVARAVRDRLEAQWVGARDFEPQRPR